jgi:RHS repeat-associated protein
MKSRAMYVGFALLMMITSVLLCRGQGNPPPTGADSNETGQYDRGTQPQLASGVSSFGSYISADIGTINLANGNLNISLPLGGVGGRGFSLPLTLNYSSKVWSARQGVDQADQNHHHYVYADYADAANHEDIYLRVTPGWSIGGVPYLRGQGVPILPYSPTTPQAASGYQYALTKLTLVLPDKGEIQLRDDSTDGAPLPAALAPPNQTPSQGANAFLYDGNRGANWHATDGSATVFVSDPGSVGVSGGDLSGTIITGDGMRYHFINISYNPGAGPTPAYDAAQSISNLARCNSVTDRNGNTITISYPSSSEVDFTDQLGRTTSIVKNAPDPANHNVTDAVLVTIPGYQGAPRYYKVITDMMLNHYRPDIAPATPVIVSDYSVLTAEDIKQYPLTATRLFETVNNGVRTGGSDGNFDEEIDMMDVVSQLVLPDSRTLNFAYDSYGEVADVQLPTGGEIQYDYAFQQGGLPSGNTPSWQLEGTFAGNSLSAIDRAVVAKRTYSTLGCTAPEGSWTYMYGAQTPNTPNAVPTPCTEVKCTGSQQTCSGVQLPACSSALLLDERHFFMTPGTYQFVSATAPGGLTTDGSGYVLWQTGLEIRTETLDQSGKVLKAEEHDWNQLTPIGNVTPVDWSKVPTEYTQSVASIETALNLPSPEQPQNYNRQTRKREILDDGSTALTTYQYDDGDPVLQFANDPTLITEYQFDQQTVARMTLMTYVNGPTYLNRGTAHLHHLISTKTIEDGGGNIASTTTYEYDDYNVDSRHAALMSYSPSPTGYAAPSYSPTLGNLTGVTISPTSTNGSATTNAEYDVLGNTLAKIDGNGNVTTIAYTDDFGSGSPTTIGAGAQGTGGPTFALPTEIQSPPPGGLSAPAPENQSQTVFSEYDYSTGLLVGFKDRNAVVAQILYSDPFDRPTEVIDAEGSNTMAAPHQVEAHTQMYYGGPTPLSVPGFPIYKLTGNDVMTVSDQQTTGDHARFSYSHTDGFGRTIQSYQSDPEGDVEVGAVYDALSRRIQVSNPYRPTGPSPGNSPVDTTTCYDPAGRVTQIQTPDGQATTISYSGPNGTTTDQAGNQRISTMDALGRLVTVVEDPGGLGYVTNYSYDPLDDLTNEQQVGQNSTPSQSRTFTYDARKLLLSAQNPESGATHYVYDGSGNVARRTDARSVVTIYTRDALNRTTLRHYEIPLGAAAATSDVTYRYDTSQYGVGRLATVSQVSAPGSIYSYDSYDALGRVTQSTQTTAGSSYRSNYSYNVAGEMTQEVYPSNRTVNMTYGSAGRLTGVADQNGPAYQSNFSYAPHGAVAHVQLGNGLWEHSDYNNRLQPMDINLGTSATDSSTLALTLQYGRITDGQLDATKNNGNIATEGINAAGTVFNQSFTYDNVNRITSGTETQNLQTTWSRNFNYDQFGNMYVTNAQGIGLAPATPQATSAFNQANNQLATGPDSLVQYDPAGNLTTDAQGNMYVYDAENKLTASTMTTGYQSSYAYDGDGDRISKAVTQNGAEPPTTTTTFVYDTKGKLIAEYGGASATPNGGTSYLTTDQLSSTRVVTNSGPTPTVVARYDYLPFGEQIMAPNAGRSGSLGYGTADDTRQKFTSKERDSESNLDYFDARYYSSAQGRFTSADDADMTNHGPRTLNLYAYVQNNPLRYLDPTGRMWWAPWGAPDTDGEEDPQNGLAGVTQKEALDDDVIYDPGENKVKAKKGKRPLIREIMDVSPKGDIMSPEMHDYYFVYGMWIRKHSNARGMVADPTQSRFTRLFYTRWIDPNSFTLAKFIPWWREQQMERYIPLMVEGMEDVGDGGLGGDFGEDSLEEEPDTGGFVKNPKGDNTAQNQYARYVADEMGLNKAQQRLLHDKITKKGFSQDEIWDIAEDIAKNNPGKR